MKISTRARYGLRLMVELTRELRKHSPVHLGRIAAITGISDNYLAQLAIALKNDGLLVGVSGKKGGYHLSRPPAEIAVSEVVRAVIGPLRLTSCVDSPDVCLNSSFCEARLIWVILSGTMNEVLNKYTLADLVDEERIAEIRETYSYLPALDADRLMVGAEGESGSGCPVAKED